MTGFGDGGGAGLRRETGRVVNEVAQELRTLDDGAAWFSGLPADEHVKAFRVLLSVFAVADTRRRETYCKGACGHAWHNLPAAAEGL
ncbi:DUF5958 family protein [Streptomyces sp. NPDC001513]|uniref:DUF5958 family protein n=1 Tax=Streptomyces sp. NPDC001513 TaxID=3364580 RepID=UPI003699E3D0